MQMILNLLNMQQKVFLPLMSFSSFHCKIIRFLVKHNAFSSCTATSGDLISFLCAASLILYHLKRLLCTLLAFVSSTEYEITCSASLTKPQH